MRKTFWALRILLLLALGVAWWPGGAALVAASTAGAPLVQFTFDDLGYRDLALRGMYGTASVWIPFQGDWAFEEPLTVVLAYEASPLLRPRSTLTVLANDLEVTSTRLEADGQKHLLSFTVPVERLRGKGVALRFRAYLRLTDEACEETNNPGQWVRILPESQVVMRPTLKVQEPNLAALADNLVLSAVDYRPQAPGLLFVLPDDPTATEMTVAAQVAQRLSAAAGRRPANLEVRTASTFDPTRAPDAPVVLIGTPQRQPWLGRLAEALPYPVTETGFLDAEGQPVPPEDGAILVAQAPWNPARWVLVVSGGSEEGLRRAGAAFADEATFAWLQGQGRFVRSTLAAPPPVPPRPWSMETTTFAQLGADDRRVDGAGVHQVYYYFRRPPGWVFDKGSRLVLRFAASPALSSREAYIAVFINDVPVGTVRIGPDFPQQEVVFDLPVERLNRTPTGQRPLNFTLRLEVANYLIEANCEQTHPEAVWTIIRADSYFITPHVFATLPDLQVFPYPFVSTDPTGDTALIVPPRPNERDLSLLLSLAAHLGYHAPAPVGLRVVPGDQATPETVGDAHLIVLGSRARQPLLETMLEALGAVPGYRGEAGLYRALGNVYQGLLREGPSPWNPDRVALLAFGETDAGYERAVQALLTHTPPVDEPGSVALVESDGTTRVIYRSSQTAPQYEPGQVNREPLLPALEPWMVLALVLLGTVLGVWLVILWARRRYGRLQREE